MIWIGCLVLLSAACALLVIQRFVIVRRIRRHIDRLNATFEGPARLELFGHVTHIGWVRQGPERIDLLTIEGEALQCDARARYRLTPLTWREFVDECLQKRVRCTGQLEHELKLVKAARAEAEERRRALRIAIADALEAFNEWASTPEFAASRANKGIQILDAAREKDEEHDALPF